MEEGRWDQAAEAYEKLIRIERGGEEPYLGALVEALIGRGVARLEGERFPEAIEDFVEVKTRMPPDSIQPALFLGKTYFLMAKKKKKAEEVFEEIYGRAQLKDDVVRNVASFYDAFGEVEKELRWVERLAEPWLREMQKGACLQSLGQNDDAITPTKGL